ncbi:MAG: metallophosphoesterase [Planctomycetota bacterium]|nr:metallophosphoesterase [Planctomycetota bacterium]
MAKLLLLSDTHGIPPDWADERESIAWLHAGDVLDQGRPSPEMARWFKARRIPVYRVRGNHDVGKGARTLEGCGEDLSGRLTRVDEGLWLAGVGWSGKVFADLPGESEFLSAIKDLQRLFLARVGGSDRIVLLSHYPVQSSAALSRLARELRPIVVVQGHIHAAFSSKEQFEGIPVVNPGPGGATLEVDPVGGETQFCPWLPQ